MCLVACHRGDALHEVEDGFGPATLLGNHGLDDLRGLTLAEAALAQEVLAILIRPGDDALPRSTDAVDEWHRRGVGEARQRRRRFLRETRRGIFRMPDRDLL